MSWIDRIQPGQSRVIPVVVPGTTSHSDHLVFSVPPW